MTLAPEGTGSAGDSGGARQAIAVSYVLVAYNSAGALREALPGIAGELETGDELILVDNASADDSAAVARELWPAARVIAAGDNSGFAAGANLGAAAARGDLIVFLNPDVRTAPGFGAAIRRPLAEPARWDAWMGLVTCENGTLVSTTGNVVHFTGLGWGGESGLPLERANVTAREVPFLSGACMAVPRAVWERYGGFAERFFMYHEDLDFSLRVRLAGGRIGIEPSARVDHDHEFHKGPAKWRYLERNRLSTIVRLYPAALLVLLLPALAATEVALLLAAIAGGWGRQKLLADAQWLRELPRLIGQRRAIQAQRVISSADFARGLTAELSSPLLGAIARVAALQWLLRAYWWLVCAALRVGGEERAS